MPEHLGGNRLPLTLMLAHLEQNKHQKSGGHFSWIGKAHNNINFIVNVNIRDILNIMGQTDWEQRQDDTDTFNLPDNNLSPNHQARFSGRF